MNGVVRGILRNSYNAQGDRTEATKKEQEEFIPAEVNMISGCHDGQVSHCLRSTSQFDIPLKEDAPSASIPGSACTSAFLEVGYKYHNEKNKKASWEDLLSDIRTTFVRGTRKADLIREQIPQLTSSRILDPSKRFKFVKKSKTKKGKKHAILIGINYYGCDGGLKTLTGSHQDVENVKRYLMDVHKFKEQSINILLDDDNDRHLPPTKKMIMASFQEAVDKLVSGDTLFVHFSGHGGQIKDEDGDEVDGMDEIIYPVDYKTSGHIVDDELLEKFVKKLRKGVLVTCLFDCCHSGTVLDLPYEIELREEKAFTPGEARQNLANVVGFERLSKTKTAKLATFAE